MSLSSVEPATGTNPLVDCALAVRDGRREPAQNITSPVVAPVRKRRRDKRAARTDSNVGLSVVLHGWASSSRFQYGFDDASMAPSVLVSTRKHLTIEYQADVPRYLDSGPLFEPPHQRSTIHDQSALYRRRGQGFAPLNTVGFASHICHGNFGEVCACHPRSRGRATSPPLTHPGARICRSRESKRRQTAKAPEMSLPTGRG